MTDFLSLEINMKRSFKVQSSAFLAAVLSGAMSTPALSMDVQGNVTLASNYIWRGIDRNNSNPAIQGGFDLNFENGLYTGIWASNVSDREEESTPAIAASNNIEMDIYGGYTQTIGNFGVDLAYIRYELPKSETDLEEVMLQASYKGLALSYYQTLGTVDVGESEYYVRAKADLNLPGAVGMTIATGQSKLKDQDSVDDVLVGFSKYVSGVRLDVSATTSNLDEVMNQDIETDFLTVSVSKAL